MEYSASHPACDAVAVGGYLADVFGGDGTLPFMASGLNDLRFKADIYAANGTLLRSRQGRECVKHLQISTDVTLWADNCDCGVLMFGEAKYRWRGRFRGSRTVVHPFRRSWIGVEV
jgi:hypothetical protein